MLQKSNRRCVTHRSAFTSNGKHPFVWGVTGECVIVYGDWAVLALKKGVCAQKRAQYSSSCARGRQTAPAWPGVFVYYHGSSLGFCSRIKGPGLKVWGPRDLTTVIAGGSSRAATFSGKPDATHCGVRSARTYLLPITYASPFTYAPSVFSSLCLLSFQTLSSSELLNMFLQAGPLQRVTGKTSVWETPWSLSSRDNTTTISRVLSLYTTRGFTGVDVNGLQNGWIRELFECV